MLKLLLQSLRSSRRIDRLAEIYIFKLVKIRQCELLYFQLGVMLIELQAMGIYRSFLPLPFTLYPFPLPLIYLSALA
jgi:hypothetical protein